MEQQQLDITKPEDALQLLKHFSLQCQNTGTLAQAIEQGNAIHMAAETIENALKPKEKIPKENERRKGTDTDI